MKVHQEINRLSVGLELEGQFRKLGELAWSKKERCAYFQFSNDFIEKPLLISPFHLPVKPGLHQATQDPFSGLHGLFNDSLPDGWGRLLLNKKLQNMGFDYRRFSPLERLAAVGESGMGALTYQPVLEGDEQIMGRSNLDWIADEIKKIQQDIPSAELDFLQKAQGSSGGARPKIMVGINRETDGVRLDFGKPLPCGYEHWMVKFASQYDPHEIGVEEHAYALMAKAAGVQMADTTVIETSKGNRLFATKRFDRVPSGRLHMHTASGLVNAAHTAPTLDYTELLKLTRMMTRDQGEVSQMFKRMVFNVFAQNRDDHAKNHAFLMGGTGQWYLSPTYDLTLSDGINGEHTTSIANEGLKPGEEHIMRVAKSASIAEKQAKQIVDEVRCAVDGWPKFAQEAGLSNQRAHAVDTALNGPRASRQAERSTVLPDQSGPSLKPSLSR
ncbi:type II toxin-antitoxin system HipA family toxin [Polycladidibacter stylochi]|uniref:type II toxin-antitoxin system HipA family toxin n=1 Tax=Polycladidibacter stylochi TaxID=1807766 RepID=UPI0009EB2F16|nr:type II toxin-antitoxin system HipA family toxin [Pseudovibrio stylochi]